MKSWIDVEVSSAKEQETMSIEATQIDLAKITSRSAVRLIDWLNRVSHPVQYVYIAVEIENNLLRIIYNLRFIYHIWLMTIRTILV